MAKIRKSQGKAASPMQQARSDAAMGAGSGEVQKGQNDIDYITGENIIQYSALQLKKFDGKKMKDSLDIDDEDEKNKLKKLKMKFESSTKLTKRVLSDMERTMKTQAMKDYSMT
eukprot:3598846-Heterocapsa_arctica.AAC.1